MDHIPMNMKLWNLFVARAKAKFNHYPSPAASHWVHDQYVKAGGRFAAADHADRDTVRVSKEKAHELAVKKKQGDEEADPAKKGKK